MAITTIGTSGSGNQSPAAIFVGTAGSGTQAVIAGYIGTAGSGNQLFYAPMSVSCSPSSVDESGNTAGVKTSPSISAIVSGGSGTYTYSWVWNTSNGDSRYPTIQTPSASSTTVSGSSTILGDVYFLDLTVTDTLTGLTAANSAVCNFTNFD